MKKYSVIVPVYNRPNEVDELLDSLTEQTLKNFTVIIIEDGSSEGCKDVIRKYSTKLDINYFFKENTGPGESRNFGMERATGEYLIFFDSDCIIPKNYFKNLDSELSKKPLDCFGGPDVAHADFSTLQKAINYSMTSFFTTGGIRGSSEKLEKFYPRSFNMGYSRKVYAATNGFSTMRFGEDIDMSIRIMQNGFKTRLIKDAYVYHKRRTSLMQFFKQIFNSGIARINLYKRHPKSLKVVHLAPALFTIGFIVLLLASIVCSVFFLLPILAHILILFIDSSFKNRSITIGMVSIVTSYIQLLGYGLGFMNATWRRIILNKGEYVTYINNFYK